jgi:hypothetical protein
MQANHQLHRTTANPSGTPENRGVPRSSPGLAIASKPTSSIPRSTRRSRPGQQPTRSRRSCQPRFARARQHLVQSAATRTLSLPPRLRPEPPGSACHSSLGRHTVDRAHHAVGISMLRPSQHPEHLDLERAEQRGGALLIGPLLLPGAVGELGQRPVGRGCLERNRCASSVAGRLRRSGRRRRPVTSPRRPARAGSLPSRRRSKVPSATAVISRSPTRRPIKSGSNERAAPHAVPRQLATPRRRSAAALLRRRRCGVPAYLRSPLRWTVGGSAYGAVTAQEPSTSTPPVVRGRVTIRRPNVLADPPFPSTSAVCRLRPLGEGETLMLKRS